MPLPPEDAAKIEAAVRAAQSRSTGQIVCVLARASANYEIMPLIWSALIALAAPWPLLILTHVSGERIFIAQLAIFGGVFGALSLPALRLLLTPARLRRSNAHRAALEQFVIRGVARCAARNGVLIFVSLAEHYARIVVDDGAAEAIPQVQWKAIVDRLTREVRDGQTVDALTTAAASCGDLLADRFPANESASSPIFQRFHIV
jgi:putative membrane protein